MARRVRARRLPPLLEDMERDPHWQEWLLLTPNQRLMRSWRMRRLLKDPEKAHDERSLPEL